MIRSSAPGVPAYTLSRHPAWPIGATPTLLLGPRHEIAAFFATTVRGRCDPPEVGGSDSGSGSAGGSAIALDGQRSFVHMALPQLARASVTAGFTAAVWVRVRAIPDSTDSTLLAVDALGPTRAGGQGCVLAGEGSQCIPAAIMLLIRPSCFCCCCCCWCCCCCFVSVTSLTILVLGFFFVLFFFVFFCLFVAVVVLSSLVPSPDPGVVARCLRRALW
jgi:hypothetical protein